MSKPERTFEEGAVLVMFSLYTVAFVALIALAVNVYLIGNALMQQRNTVEYVAMAAIKSALEPSVDLASCNDASEVDLLNCVFARAEVAGEVKAGSSAQDYYLPKGRLRVKNRSEQCDSGNQYPVEEPIDGDVPDDSDGSNGKDFCWKLYQITDERYARVVVGTYAVDPTTGRGTFTAALSGDVLNRNFNAVKLQLKLDPNLDASMIAPFIRVFGEGMGLNFSSGAIAYWTAPGKIQLAIDPYLPTL